MNWSLRSFALGLLVGLLWTHTGRAGDLDDDRKERAHALMREGKARYDLGKFDEAIDLFEKAYEVYPFPEALLALGQAYRQKKDYERAAFYYRSYLRNKPDAGNRTEVEDRIIEMDELVSAGKAAAGKPPRGISVEPTQHPGGSERRIRQLSNSHRLLAGTTTDGDGF